jgi:hypothetical protein
MANFINIQVVAKKKKWYHQFLGVIAFVFSQVARIGGGAFDFLMDIPVVGHLIELQLWIIAKLAGTSYENVEEFARENTGMLALALLTAGATSGIDAGIGATIELVVATTVEMLVEIGLGYLAVGVMIAYYAVLALVVNTGMAISQVTGLPTSIEALINQIMSALYQAGLEMNAETQVMINEIQEEIKEENQIVSFKDMESEQKEMYETAFMPLDKLDKGFNPFDKGGMFDIQNKIEGGY